MLNNFTQQMDSQNMSTRLKVLDDLAQLAGGAVGLISHLQQQIRSEVRERIDETVTRLELVPKEDFDRLQAMLTQARKEQKQLEERIDQLEKKQGTNQKRTTKKSPARTTKQKK